MDLGGHGRKAEFSTTNASVVGCTLLVAALLVLPAPSQASTGGCDVTDGDSIQDAIDDADPYTTIEVCDGTYEEQVTIGTDGLQLVGNGTPTLDGDGLTEGHGITLEQGVRDILIANLDVTEYDPLVDGNVSSGIVSEGDTANVTVRNTTVTDNAWAGIMLSGSDAAWTLENNTLERSGFAQLLAYDTTLLDVQGNDVDGGDYGLLLAGTTETEVDDNHVTGDDGHAGIAVTPTLGDVARPSHVTITEHDHPT
jgi:parallel beta-helix repeat protein